MSAGVGESDTTWSAVDKSLEMATQTAKSKRDRSGRCCHAEAFQQLITLCRSENDDPAV